MREEGLGFELNRNGVEKAKDGEELLDKMLERLGELDEEEAAKLLSEKMGL